MASAPPRMTPTTSVDDLRTLVLSFHPVIAIDTVEEERVEALLEAVAAQLSLPLMEWSVTSGLKRHGEQSAVYGTADPRQVLSHIAESGIDATYWLKDFAPHLSTPQVVRLLRDVTERMSEARTVTTLVLTGADIQLPDDIMPAAIYYELPMPTDAEYREAIDWVTSSVAWRNGSKVDTGGLDTDQLVRALSGMTLNQARHPVAYPALN